MDTESIASEIVNIRTRLREMDDRAEEAAGTDIDDDRKGLEERMHELQEQLAEHGSPERDKPGTVQYVPPG